MGMDKPNIRELTIADLCEQTGANIDAVRAQWNRTVREETGAKFDRTFVPTSEQWAMLAPRTSGKSGQEKKQTRPAKPPKDKSVLSLDDKPAAVKAPSPVIQEQAPTKDNPLRRGILYALMGTVAAASVQNMLRVTYDIGGDEFTAVLLTVLFSLAPFLFVLAGMTSAATRLLTGVLIVYECFCNFTRIYGGLTGFGHNGNPTRFLGLVTDVFHSGTYQTAAVLAAIMAIIAASVFYAAYNELNKS